MKIIDTTLLDKVSGEAKVSPRLRMNYNFHQSLDDKCHRFLMQWSQGLRLRYIGIQRKMSLLCCYEVELE